MIDITSYFMNNAYSTALLVLKIMYLLAISLYLAFAVLIVRQISLMTGTLVSNISSSIKLIGIIHLLIAIGVFILAIFTL